MSQTHLNLALAYYQALNDKNLSAIATYFHPNIKLISPLAEVDGKEAALQAAKGFYSLFNKLTVRAQFSAHHQVMVAYDVEFPAPAGLLRAAALLSFSEGLIISIEMFYDTKPVEALRAKIFAQT